MKYDQIFCCNNIIIIYDYEIRGSCKISQDVVILDWVLLQIYSNRNNIFLFLYFGKKVTNFGAIVRGHINSYTLEIFIV